MGSRDNRTQVLKVLHLCEKQGCVVTLRNNGHYRIDLPNGKTVFCAATPSDHRGVKRTISRLRQYGMTI
jgi:hypothetical protein